MQAVAMSGFFSYQLLQATYDYTFHRGSSLCLSSGSDSRILAADAFAARRGCRGAIDLPIQRNADVSYRHSKLTRNRTTAMPGSERFWTILYQIIPLIFPGASFIPQNVKILDDFMAELRASRAKLDSSVTGHETAFKITIKLVFKCKDHQASRHRSCMVERGEKYRLEILSAGYKENHLCP